MLKLPLLALLLPLAPAVRVRCLLASDTLCLLCACAADGSLRQGMHTRWGLDVRPTCLRTPTRYLGIRIRYPCTKAPLAVPTPLHTLDYRERGAIAAERIPPGIGRVIGGWAVLLPTLLRALQGHLESAGPGN